MVTILSLYFNHTLQPALGQCLPLVQEASVGEVRGFVGDPVELEGVGSGQVPPWEAEDPPLHHQGERACLTLETPHLPVGGTRSNIHTAVHC